MMLRHLFLLIAAGFAAYGAETVLYRDDFDRDSGPLAGHSPAVSLTGSGWVTQYRGLKHSFFGNGKLLGSQQQSVWLPFTPRSGHRYSLEASLFMQDGPTDRGVSLGFSAVDANQTFDKISTYGTIVMFRNPRKTFEAFVGPGKENPVTTSGNRVVPTHVRIILDASAPSPTDWTVSFFLDELPIQENIAVPATAGSLGEIQFVGFTAIGGGSVGQIQNFLLTETPSRE